ncbi:hypothetical protein [Helicobacter bizzozeronii]|nr:hypothetical protein [Helicobacter bizzozeronii]
MKAIKTKMFPKIKIYPYTLHATINNSIGDIKNHITLEQLVDLFLNPPTMPSLIERYVIDTIQTEASAQEIDFFAKSFNIPSQSVEHILSMKLNWGQE